MDDMMKIHLLIDNERYPMTIRREDEQLYRDAAKQIDNKLNKYRSYYPDFSPARHWAMAALELAFENISMKDRNNTARWVCEQIPTCFKVEVRESEGNTVIYEKD